MKSLVLNILRNSLNTQVIKSIEEYIPGKRRIVLIVFYDMITDKISNKKLQPIVAELFFRGKELNIFLVFITQSNFLVPKTTHIFFYTNIPNRWEVQKIVISYLILTSLNLRGFTENVKSYRNKKIRTR